MSANTRQYAQNLLDSARRDGKEDTYLAELSRINDRINASEELREYFNGAQNTLSEKKERAEELFGSSEVLSAFFRSVAANGNSSLTGMIEDFTEVYYQSRGICPGILYSVRPLDEGTVERVEKAVSSNMGTPVKLRSRIDESLLGGIKVVVNDRVWDGS